MKISFRYALRSFLAIRFPVHLLHAVKAFLSASIVATPSWKHIHILSCESTYHSSNTLHGSLPPVTGTAAAVSAKSGVEYSGRLCEVCDIMRGFQRVLL